MSSHYFRLVGYGLVALLPMLVSTVTWTPVPVVGILVSASAIHGFAVALRDLDRDRSS